MVKVSYLINISQMIVDVLRELSILSTAKVNTIHKLYSFCAWFNTAKCDVQENSISVCILLLQTEELRTSTCIVHGESTAHSTYWRNLQFSKNLCFVHSGTGGGREGTWKPEGRLRNKTLVKFLPKVYPNKQKHKCGHRACRTVPCIYISSQPCYWWPHFAITE